MTSLANLTGLILGRSKYPANFIRVEAESTGNSGLLMMNFDRTQAWKVFGVLRAAQMDSRNFNDKVANTFKRFRTCD